MSIRPLWPPEPPGGGNKAPEIFAGGVGTVRRAVVIGNGCAGAENQCLGLTDRLTLFIQHPRYRLDRFDLVVTPRHDYYALTAKGQQEVPWLFRRWITPREPPGPNVVLTAGALHQADSAALRIAATNWHDELAPLPKPLVSDLILKEFSTHPKFYIWDGEEPNPHPGHLAWADAFIVTANSISMLSEACSTG
ncbi:hypothetical protein ACQ4PT_059515 [Festuca glaucescens]